MFHEAAPRRLEDRDVDLEYMPHGSLADTKRHLDALKIETVAASSMSSACQATKRHLDALKIETAACLTG